MPTKEMSKNAKYWDKRRLQKYAENEKKSEVYIRNIQSLYEKANKDIDKMISNVYKNYSKDTGLDVQKLKELLTKSETKKTWKELEKKGLDKYVKDNYKSRITRLEQIKAQVYERAKDIYPKEDFTQTELYRSVINDSYYKAIYNVQRGTGIGFSFNKLDNNVMNNLLSEKWSGRNYSERIWTNTDILANELSQVIGSALIGGRGVEVTAKEIRDRFNVGKYYAERLVRTEMNYYDNQADAMAYEEMGIDEFVPVATLDNRTSAYCAKIDGKHFKYSEMEIGVNYPPFHPNCRCTTRGYLGEDVEKMLTRRARNPVTEKNEIISNMKYNEWKKKYVTNNDIEKSTKTRENISKKVKETPKNKNYKDVTKEWLKNATPNSHEVKDIDFYQYNGETYRMDKTNKNVTLDYSDKEKSVAEWIEKVFGGEIYLNPRINYPKNIPTADYLWKKERWDLKELKKSTSLSRAVDNVIKGCKEQSNNFILDLTNCKLTDDIILEQVKNTFDTNSKFYREWVKKIIIKRDDELIKVITKK